MKYDSRYREADSQIVLSHSYDETGVREMNSETDSPVATARTALYRLTTLPLPTPPEDTHQVSVVESFPTVAKSLFDDQQRWWVVADANPHIRHPLDLKTADVIYLP